MLEIDATLNNGVRRSPRAEAIDQRAGFAARLFDGSVRAMTPNGEQINARLRIGLIILVLLEAAHLLEIAMFESKERSPAIYFFSFDVVLTISIFYATFLGWFERHWRGATMAFCMAVILSRMLLGVAMEEDEPVLMALFAIVLGTAMLMPWSARWQAWLSVAAMLSFTVVSLMGAVDLEDLQRWLILAVTMAFAVSFTALKQYHLLQAALVADLKENESRLSEHIEELTATQVQLRSEHEQAVGLATIVNACDDAIVGLDEQLRITTLSAAAERTYGYTPIEAIGRGLDLFVPAEELGLALELSNQVLRTGQPVSFEQRARRRDRTWFTSQVGAFAIRGADGEIVGMAGIGRDITHLKDTQRELMAAREAALAASHAKSEFLSSMSHEIRTPMNAILGMADLLSDDPAIKPDQRRYLDIMRSNGNALLHLINDILDLAKIESGKLSLEPLSFDLDELVDKSLATMGLRTHSKGLELTAHIAPGVPNNLIGDSLRLGQILINLIGNAIKFTDKGEVALTVEALPPGVDDDPTDASQVRLRFSVSDTGIGIPADKLESIFGGFSQADASISRRFGGSGLGLPIVSRLAKLMDGTVKVESEPGHGSTFSVTVTLRADPSPVRVAASEAAKLDGVPILIVDDNATNRLILREALVRAGAEPGEADGGEAGLAELARARAAGRPYRLMLLDYRMPGMDGAEVARRVMSEHGGWKSADCGDTLILMLTSEDLNFQLARLHELGLRTYLVKPIKRAELLETIGKLLSGVDAVQTRGVPLDSSPAPAADRQLRILLADDSPDNRLLIQAYLKDHPYAIETAEDGNVAIEKFKASPHDLVLMDIRMPDVDGLTATRTIRKWEREMRLAPTPIVALSASALEEDVRASLDAGCDAHVSKPVRKRVLLQAIHKAVGASDTTMESASASAHSSPVPATPVT